MLVFSRARAWENTRSGEMTDDGLRLTRYGRTNLEMVKVFQIVENVLGVEVFTEF